jgi:chorismate dehydratase
MNKGFIRFGCHNFLNVRPLIDPIMRGEIPHRLNLIMDMPSRLSDMMQKGEIDLGWIPSIEYGRIKDCLIIPGISISSYMSVKSVVLISRVRFEKIGKIALDISSRTSVVMIKILFKKYGVTPELISMPPDFQKMMGVADAALIIGDNALMAEKEGFIVYDLGEEWYKFFGLTFVHALLLVRPSFSLGDQVNVLFKARDMGLSRIDRIIDEESKKLGISSELCRDYFEKRVYYELGEKELEGLLAFYSLANKEGYLEKVPELRFYE